MELQTAQTLALRLMKEFGLMDGPRALHYGMHRPWSFQFDNRKKRFGSCSESRRTISLSAPLTRLNDDATVEDCIRHEIAHALAGHKAGHGLLWKSYCRTTGADPSRCYEIAKVNRPEGDWQAACPGCKTMHYMFRKPKRNGTTACVSCCRKYAGGKFSNRFLLVYYHKSTGMAKSIASYQPKNNTPAPADRTAEIEAMKKRILELGGML
jgi:predicted SprT family Zn-dependent metalloprotease